ncbi:MAG: hypothetical protein WC547_01165 [Candidatus Omnitrophota bacterium]
MTDLEHPDITHALKTGYPREMPDEPVCPVCGEVCEIIYRDRYDDVFGCDNCVKKKFV